MFYTWHGDLWAIESYPRKVAILKSFYRGSECCGGVYFHFAKYVVAGVSCSRRTAAEKDWYYGFLKRNPEVSVRVPEATSVTKITAFNQSEMQLFFKNLFHLLEKHFILSNRIFNLD